MAGLGETSPLLDSSHLDHRNSSTQNIGLGSNLYLYKYRWFILLLFSLYSAVNLFQLLQYTIITNIVARYYNVSSFSVSWASLIFMASYIFLFIPGSYIMEKFSLRMTAIACSFLTAAGNLVKLASVEPDRFYVVIIGQVFCGIGQVFMMSVPSKLAAVWFGSKEVSTACSLAVVGSQIGVALSCILVPALVENHNDIEDIGRDLFKMLIYNAVVSYVTFILIIFLFQGRPKLPPSNSQALLLEAEKPDYVLLLRKLCSNKDYISVLVSFGIGNGIWSSFGVIVNVMYLNYFPNGEKEVGLLGLITIIFGGMLGNFAFGYFLDKTHEFKKSSFFALLISCLSFLALTLVLEFRLKLEVFIAVAVFGFFIGGSLVMAYEYIAELTYPEPEQTACAIFNAVVLFFGVITVIVYQIMITKIGVFWTNIIITVIIAGCAILTTRVDSVLKRNCANNISQNKL